METMTTPRTTGARSIRVAEGLVGFPDATGYALHPVVDGLYDLVPEAGDDGPSFVAVDAAVFYPAYHPEIDDVTAARLGITDEAQAQVLLIVTMAPEPSRSTVNLLAPVVLNVGTGEAEQVVLVGQDFPLRAPLVPDAA